MTDEEPLGVQLIRATETLAQDRDRWKAQAEQLQAQLEQQTAVDEDEIVKLAEVRGLAFALDHVGYDGLGNMAIVLERRVKNLERALEVIVQHDPVQEWKFSQRLSLISVARAMLQRNKP